jgi:kynurenine formamidase
VLRVIDLTQPLGPSTPSWPGATRVRATELATCAADGLYDRDLVLPEHVGTHLDAPAHFAVAGAFAHQIAAESLVRPVRRVDVRAIVGDDPRATVTADQVRGIEREEGRLERGCVAVFHTGWDRFLGAPAAYVGPAAGPPRFPGLAPDVADLAVERRLAGVGIDTLGVDPGHASGYPFHRITLAAGLWHLEGLVSLGHVPARGALIVVGALPVERGSGAPARVLALVPPGPAPTQT